MKSEGGPSRRFYRFEFRLVSLTKSTETFSTTGTEDDNRELTPKRGVIVTLKPSMPNTQKSKGEGRVKCYVENYLLSKMCLTTLLDKWYSLTRNISER